MDRFVVGFLFRCHYTEVCLLLKNRPDWQKGRWNAIGGHIEPGETPLQAMTREFQEEADLEEDWTQFARLYGKDYELFCFTASRYDPQVSTMTDEPIGWFGVDNLPISLVSNARWLIPMAMYPIKIEAEIHHESPTC